MHLPSLSLSFSVIKLISLHIVCDCECEGGGDIFEHIKIIMHMYHCMPLSENVCTWFVFILSFCIWNNESNIILIFTHKDQEAETTLTFGYGEDMGDVDFRKELAQFLTQQYGDTVERYWKHTFCGFKLKLFKHLKIILL